MNSIGQPSSDLSFRQRAGPATLFHHAPEPLGFVLRFAPSSVRCYSAGIRRPHDRPYGSNLSADLLLALKNRSIRTGEAGLKGAPGRWKLEGEVDPNQSEASLRRSGRGSRLGASEVLSLSGRNVRLVLRPWKIKPWGDPPCGVLAFFLAFADQVPPDIRSTLPDAHARQATKMFCP
ncbi:hypothetical protein VTN00DRAFT_1858 [Thermoascus crustaceus]|uniref:uncharacterized protein n=1 Tax=Thermoascus crustaceus TaxID=5088 RepID=UPI003743FAA2